MKGLAVLIIFVQIAIVVWVLTTLARIARGIDATNEVLGEIKELLHPDRSIL